MNNNITQHIIAVFRKGELFYGPKDLFSQPSSTLVYIDNAGVGDVIHLVTGTYRVDQIAQRIYADKTTKDVYLEPVDEMPDDMAKKYINNAREAVLRIIDAEVADIDIMTPEDGETLMELKVRKANWRAAVRAVRTRVLAELNLEETPI